MTAAPAYWPTKTSILALILLCILALISTVAHSAAADAIDETLPAVNAKPVAVVQANSGLPEDWHRGAFIEIFVRAYQDSNGDGIGDLRGLTQRLDYLQSLGVKGIWLMPINPSQDGDHGYAVKDYRNIEPAYGTLEDFDELIKQAHARGIGIIVDYLINHSAAEHPAFIQSAASPENTYRQWYLWQEKKPVGWSIFNRDPWVANKHGAYFGQFSDQMPDFNLLNPQVIAFHLDNMRFWLNRGVDGFRFDAVAHLIENGKDAWYDQPGNTVMMKALVNEIHANYPNRFVVCEATQNVERYASADACGNAFAFGYQYDLIRAAKADRKSLKKIAAFYNTHANNLVSFASNHDLFAGDRLMNQFNGDIATYKLAAAMYLLQPGTPFIYYGEEIGMRSKNALQGDPRLRTPMSWNGDGKAFSPHAPFRGYADNMATHHVELQKNDPDSLLSFYKAMLGLRHQYPSIMKGNYQHAFTTADVMGFQRQLGSQTSLILINTGKKASSIDVKKLKLNSVFSMRYPETKTQLRVDAKGMAKLTLPAQSVTVFVQE
jgi:alpha-amylase